MPATTYALESTLSFEPVTQSAQAGQEITIDINIHSDNQEIASSDIWLQYPTRLLEFKKSETKPGSLFTSVDAKVMDDFIYLYGIQTNPLATKPTNGTIATLTFMTKTAGNAEFRFICDPSTSMSSQIIRNDAAFTNIINCELTQAHTAAVAINDGSVLGVSDEAKSPLTYTVGGSIIFVLCAFFIISYIRTHHRSA